jgi:putative transposase
VEGGAPGVRFGQHAAPLFSEGAEAGGFPKLWLAGLLEYDRRKGIQGEWQSIDGAMKGVAGGRKDGAQPHRSS